MQQIYSVLEQHAKERALHSALECDGSSVTYQELLQSVDSRISSFQQAGLTKHHVVFVTTGRGIAYWIDMLAVWSLGAVAVPLDSKIEWLVLEVYIQKAAPDFMVGQLVHGDKFQSSSIDDIHCIHESQSDDEAVPEDLAAIYFTSGSTGQPKGVMLSGPSVWGNANAVIDIIPIEHSDRLLVPVPFHFTSTICHFLASILTGSTLVLTEGKALFKDVMDLVNNHDITALGGAPLHLKWLLECEQDISSMLRWVMSSGDVLPVETINGYLEKLPEIELITVYGLTEVGGRLTILTHQGLKEHKGSVGKPIPGMKVHAVDENDQPLPAGEEGEIIVSGDFLFDGYMRDTEKNKKSFLGEGFRTGDVGKVTESGFVYLLGRNDDVFKVAGKKVSAAWITTELAKTGYFEDVAVVGKEYPGFGNIPWACYVLKEGEEFSRFKLTAALREHLPLNHIPQQYVEVSHIPRTGSGKVNRKEMRAMIDQQS